MRNSTPTNFSTISSASPKPKYRYENPGGTVGGPVIIPKVRFNQDRNHLFFFYSWDQLWNTQSTAINKYTMPTALERQGNFSQSVNTNGSPIPVRDPLSGQTCSADGRGRLLPGQHHSAEPPQPDRQRHAESFPAAEYGGSDRAAPVQLSPTF